MKAFDVYLAGYLWITYLKKWIGDILPVVMLESGIIMLLFDWRVWGMVEMLVTT